MAQDPTGGGYQVSLEEQPPQPKDVSQERQEKVQEFIELAQQRFRTVVEAEGVLRQQMLEDLRFRASEQWPPHIEAMRNADNRPCLTINRIPQFIRQVTNNQRASRPAVQVNPAGDAADVEVAEVLQGLVRHIELKSDADVAYTTAGEHQCTMGRGYIRVVTDYIEDDPSNLDQEVKIVRVPNPFSVYMDPTSQKPDFSDANYGFVVEDIPRAEYRFRYPQSELADLANFTGPGNAQEEWLPDGTIRIAEYFYIEEEREVMVVLETPDGSRVKEPKRLFKKGTLENPPAGMRIIAEREQTTRTVRWALINAIEVLEGNDDLTAGMVWPGKYIPLIPVLGDEININGVRDYRGIVRDTKDA